MKISNKILGLVLALVMIFNVFAVCSSAALGTDSAVVLTVKTDKASYEPGEDVVITLYAQADSQVAALSQGTQLVYTYDATGLAPYSTSETITEHGYAPASQWAASTNYYDTAMSAVYDSATSEGNGAALSTEDIAAGRDTFISVYTADGSESVFVDAQAEAIPLYSFKMKAGTTVGSYSIGINVPFLDSFNAYVTSENLGQLFYNSDPSYMGISGVTATYETVDATFEVAAPKKVFHKATQIQWADKDANIVNMGFKGYFNAADIAIAFGDDTTADNVTAVGAKITANGTQTKGTRWVYSPDSGVTYEFRAILPVDLDTDADTVITVEYFVEFNGETYWSDPVTTTASAHRSRLPA